MKPKWSGTAISVGELFHNVSTSVASCEVCEKRRIAVNSLLYGLSQWHIVI